MDESKIERVAAHMAGEPNPADDESVGGTTVDALPVVHCIIAPVDDEDANPLYIATWRALGSMATSAKDACGGSLQDMINMLSAIHVRICGDEPPRTVIDAYIHNCHLFGIAPNDIIAPSRVKQLTDHVMVRVLKLHMGIEVHLMEQRALLEQSATSSKLVCGGDTARDDIKESCRIKLIAIMKVLDSASVLLTDMMCSYAAQVPTCTITSRFPPMAFMDDNIAIRPLSDSQKVERALLKALFVKGCRRFGDSVMEPHFTKVNGKTVSTHTYSYMCSIEHFVEAETSMASNFTNWRNRGRPEFLIKNLTKTVTYLFPSLIVNQGVYACRDCIFDLLHMKFYFFDPRAPRVQTFIAQRDATVEAIRREILVHREMVSMATPVIEILSNGLAKAGGCDGDSGGAVEVVNAALASLSAFTKDAHLVVSSIEDIQGELELRQLVVAEHEQHMQTMESTCGFLTNLIATHDAPGDVVGEMFIDLPFPFANVARMFKLVRRRTLQKVAPTGDGNEGGGGDGDDGDDGDDQSTDLSLTNGYLDVDWEAIRTPSWQYLYEYQKLPREATLFAAYVMFGRMIFPPHVFDTWQVVYEEVGWSNTGKSLKARNMEMLHTVFGTQVTRTGILTDNIEDPFGPSQVLGENPEERAFAVIHRDMTEKFVKNFPTGMFLVWAANEEYAWPIKHKSPLIVKAPHTALFGNAPLKYRDTGDNINRRRITVRNNTPVDKANPDLIRIIETEERIALMIKSAIAYQTMAKSCTKDGIWNSGILPEYFHEQRRLNRMANQPLVAFIMQSQGDTILLDKLRTGEDAASPATFMSQRRLQGLVTTFIEKNRTQRVDWADNAQIVNTMRMYGCKVVIPAQCNPDELPSGLRTTARGKWIIGMHEIQGGGDGGGGGGGGGGAGGGGAGGGGAGGGGGGGSAGAGGYGYGYDGGR